MNKKQLCGNIKANGFTLIELLVVILIIGILAAVALPQYQKAVWRSRNALLKQIVRSVAQAERTYYLEHGVYAANFKELDIDLPLTPVKTKAGTGTGKCNTNVQGTDSSRQGKDFYVALNMDPETTTSNVLVAAYYDKGPYQCAGFGMNPGSQDAISSTLHCREMIPDVYFKAGKGNFCNKIERSISMETGSSWYRYKLP